jgi:hypothetical protein
LLTGLEATTQAFPRYLLCGEPAHVQRFSRPIVRNSGFHFACKGRSAHDEEEDLMEPEELELKRQEHRLEKWKTFISILTPVVLAVLAFVVNNAIQERGEVLKRQEQILSDKQKIYGTLGANLNVMFVYITDVGDFRQYTPVEIVKRKRDTDRMFFMYRPYWSDKTEQRYNDYMKAAFHTYNGAGLPAKINTLKFEKVEAYKNDGLVWNSSWDQYFTEQQDADISSKYYALVSSLLADTVNPDIRKLDAKQ